MTVTRSSLTVASIFTATLVAVAGCSSSSSGGSPPHTSSSGPTSPSPSANAPSTSTSSSPSTTPSPSWSPPAYGAAQPAVDVYLAMLKSGNAAFRDPAHASTAAIDKYADGQIRYVYHQSLAESKKDGIAYRGTPDTSRVTVRSSKLDGPLPTVVLRDCALSSATDPEVEFYVATGKPVPSPPGTVTPPYANTITVYKTKGVWRVFVMKTDASKTCQP